MEKHRDVNVQSQTRTTRVGVLVANWFIKAGAKQKLIAFGLVLTLGSIGLLYYDPPPADKSFMTDIPCAPPCWQNLTPEMSTRTDVESFIKDLSPSEKETLAGSGVMPPSLWDFFGGGRKMYSWTNRLEVARRIEVEHNRVVFIVVGIDFVLPLETVVAHFGTPEYIFTQVTYYHHAGMFYELEVYYPHQGIVFRSVLDAQETGEVRPDMLADEVCFFAPGDLENYFKGAGYTSGYMDKHMRSIKPWPGFGRIQ
jgi:hypothetical protein